MIRQVYGTQTVGLIIGITNACVGGAMMIIGIAMCVAPALLVRAAYTCDCVCMHRALPSLCFCNSLRRYWLDRQSNRHRILLDDSDLGDEAPATHTSTSSLFAAILTDRNARGMQAPPGSPRACDYT